MGNKDWDIEECRTKFESDEHWNLKKEFLLAHKDKIEKNRLICLAAVFVNVQLMRCKYPDPVMRQVAELSKGIGVDYKTKQKERLQRTFVKASDAASAKVKKINPKYSKTPCETKTKSENNLEEVSEDNTVIASKNKNKHKQIVWDNDKDGTSESKTLGNSKNKRKRLKVDCDTVPVKNKYAEALKTDSNPSLHKKDSNSSLSSYLSPKVASLMNKKKKETLQVSETRSFFKEPSDQDELYSSNIFLMSRKYLRNITNKAFLHDVLQFSRLTMDILYQDNMCILTTKVKGRMIQLGEGEGSSQTIAYENAVQNAIENLLQKCYTIEMKKKIDDDTQISMDMLNEEFSNQPGNKEEAGPGGIGAKMLKLMGWTGGGLGKNEDGIKEPVSLNTPIGREGLGLRGENVPTPVFKNKVRNILDEMNYKVTSTLDNVVKDTIFSPDLSNAHRKHIHLLVNRQYRNLKSVSYGTGNDRFLVIRPRNDPKNLIRKVLLQGGSTDNYTVHCPGTLSITDLVPPQETG